MNAQILIRPPRYKPEFIKANRLGPKGRIAARERDRKLYMLMQEREIHLRGYQGRAGK